MKFKDFKKIYNTLVECHDKMEKYYNVLKIDEVWNEHNEAITLLLEQIYEKTAVNYVLNEWLDGNRSPITYKDNETGNIIEVPLNTLEDLWRAMESYRLDKCSDSAKET